MRKLLLVLILFIAVNGFAQGLKLTGWTTTTNPATARTALGISNQFDFLPTRVLYVSTNGNDSTFVKGRRDLPARNFGYAASNALSGELVYVFAGEFKKTNTTCATNVSFYFEPGSRLIQTNDTESMFSARDGGSAITNNIFGSGVFIHHSDINPTFDYDIVLSKLNLECQSVDSLGTGALFQMDLGTINVRATDFLNSRGYDFIYGTPIWGHIDVPNIYVADDLVEFTGTFPGQTFFHLKAGKIVIGNPPSGAVDGDNAQMNTNTFIECDQLWITNGVAGLALIRGPGTMTVGSVHIAANVTNTFVQGAILKGSKIYVASGGALYTQNFEPADSPGIDSPPVFIDCQMDTGVIISNGPTLINVTIGTNLYNTSIATNSVIGTELNSQKQVPLVFTGAGYSRSGNTLTFSGSGSFNGTNMAKAKTIVLDDVDSYTITNGSLDGSMIVMDCTFADNTVTITDQDRDGYPFHFYKRNSGGFISYIATSGDTYAMTNDGDSLMLISVLATNGSQYWLAQRNDGTGNFPNGITVGGQAMTFTPTYYTNTITTAPTNWMVNPTNGGHQIIPATNNVQLGFAGVGKVTVQIDASGGSRTNTLASLFRFLTDTNLLTTVGTNRQVILADGESMVVRVSRPTDEDTNTTIESMGILNRVANLPSNVLTKTDGGQTFPFLYNAYGATNVDSPIGDSRGFVASSIYSSLVGGRFNTGLNTTNGGTYSPLMNIQYGILWGWNALALGRTNGSPADYVKGSVNIGYNNFIGAQYDSAFGYNNASIGVGCFTGGALNIAGSSQSSSTNVPIFSHDTNAAAIVVIGNRTNEFTVGSYILIHQDDGTNPPEKQIRTVTAHIYDGTNSTITINTNLSGANVICNSNSSWVMKADDPFRHYATAFGYKNRVLGNYSFGVGASNYVLETGFVSGLGNWLPGNLSYVLGSFNTNAGANSWILGSYNSQGNFVGQTSIGMSNANSRAYSTTLGLQSKAISHGEIAEANGIYSTPGDAQVRRVIQRGSTALINTNWFNIWNDGTGGSEGFNLQNATLVGVTARLIGSNSANTKRFDFEIKGTVRRGGGVATVIWEALTVNFRDVATITAALDVSTGTALKVKVQDTAGGGDTIKWVARVEGLEVTP